MRDETRTGDLAAADEAATARYEAAWDARDRLVTAIAALVAALFPGAFLVIGLGAPRALAVGLLLAWLLGTFVAVALLWAWLCPRCGEPFHWPDGVPFDQRKGVVRLRRRMFGRVRCGSCGLARRVRTERGAEIVRATASEFRER